MKRLLMLFLMIAAVIILSAPLRAEDGEGTGGDILRDCSLALEMAQEGYVTELVAKGKPLPTNTQQIAAAKCFNYVVGFKDALYVADIFLEKNGKQRLLCLPKNNLNNGEALRLVLKYLIDNPTLLNSPQAAVIFNAFYYAYPCSK